MAHRTLSALIVVAVASLVFACQLWPNSSPEDEDKPDPAPQQQQGDSTVVDWRAPFDVAVGDAFRGPWRMNDSEFHYVDDPGVAIGDNGDIHMVWVDNEQQDAFYRRFGADGDSPMDEPANISNSPDIFSWLPMVAPSSVDDDTVYVLWQEIIFRPGGGHGGEILFSRSQDGGETFEEPTNLSDTVAGAGKGRLTPDRWNNGSLDMVVGPEDELYVAWTEYEGALRFARSDDGGESFEEPRHIVGDDQQPARAPTLALAPDGRLILAWTMGQDPEADILLTASDDGGESFQQVSTPVETPAHSDAPQLAVDDEETVHLVFSDSPDGLFERYRVLHTYSTDRGASFEAPTEVSETDEDADSANFPSLAVDGNRVFITWEYYPDYRYRPLGLGFAASDDRGESFEPASFVPGTDDEDLGISGGLQGMLMRKLDADDGLLVVGHSHFLDNEVSRVWVTPGSFEPPVASQ